MYLAILVDEADLNACRKYVFALKFKGIANIAVNLSGDKTYGQLVRALYYESGFKLNL